MTQPPLERILEAALQAAGKPLSLERMRELFDEHTAPSLEELRQALALLAKEPSERSVEVRDVASGWRLTVRDGFARLGSHLGEVRPH